MHSLGRTDVGHVHMSITQASTVARFTGITEHPRMMPGDKSSRAQACIAVHSDIPRREGLLLERKLFKKLNLDNNIEM